MNRALTKSVLKRPFLFPSTFGSARLKSDGQKLLDIAEKVGKWQKISIDRSGLLGNRSIDYDEDPKTALLNKEELSPLAKELQSAIKARGPLSMHEYMSQCLNHSTLGYYQQKNAKIGSAGDFITSPEISQLFGEMIAIWCISVWESLGKPNRLNLVELGPGKGTLMKDILHVSKKFTPFKDSLRVHFVELSQNMRNHQYDAVAKKGSLPLSQAIADCVEVPGSSGVSVQWYSFLKQIPNDIGPMIVIGQEFLDAFPVHQFALTKRGWREKLIDIDTSSKSRHHFRVVMSPNTTPAVGTLLTTGVIPEGLKSELCEAKLNRVAALKAVAEAVAKSGTDTVASKPVLPKVLTKGAGITLGQTQSAPIAAATEPLDPSQFLEGDGIEICPLSIATCEEVATRIVTSGGASLMIDYGENHTPEDSLRGFKKHGQVSVLSEPGMVDITADVDFHLCTVAATAKGATVLPLSTQGDFLMRLGVVERVQELLKLESVTAEQGRAMVDSLRKLVDPAQMGRRFKVLGMTSPGLSVPGFPDPAQSKNVNQ